MELIDQRIYKIRNKIFSSNSYILKDEIDNTCLLIDLGLDTDLIDEELTKLNLVPLAIISTHGHFDHIGSVSFFKKKYNIPFYLHEADMKISQSANFYMKVVKINHKIETPTPDFFFKEKQQTMTIGNFDLSIYNFPGHSPGSCIIKIDNYLFSGDIFYKNGLGFESIPRENKLLLKKSIVEIFGTFDDNNLVLPGHGLSEYLGNIKQNNVELNNFISDKSDANA